MKTTLTALSLATLLAVGAGTAASAQDFGVRVGPGGAAVDIDRPRRGRDVEVEVERRGPRVDREVVEERIVRRPRRTVCRTVIRERVTPGGTVIRRPTEVCSTVGGRDRF